MTIALRWSLGSFDLNVKLLIPKDRDDRGHTCVPFLSIYCLVLSRLLRKTQSFSIVPVPQWLRSVSRVDSPLSESRVLPCGRESKCHRMTYMGLQPFMHMECSFRPHDTLESASPFLGVIAARAHDSNLQVLGAFGFISFASPLSVL